MGRRNGTVARLGLAGVLATAWTLTFGAVQALAATTIEVNPLPAVSPLSIEDESGVDNVITLSESGGVITVTETGAGTIAAGPECSEVNPTTVACPLVPIGFGQVRFVQLVMGDGTDSFTNLNFDASVIEFDFSAIGDKTVNSGPANDQIITGAGNDAINTGTGSDRVSSEAGNDMINTGPGSDGAGGNPGSDSIELGEGTDFFQEEGVANGADVVNGGPGVGDSVSYGFGFEPVTMTLNGIADDGHAGEGDNLLGFENLNGGDGGDTIVGDGSDNELSGGGGNDTILGAGGDDEIFPGPGNDSVDGGEGADSVDGGSESEDGADLLNGGGGSGDSLAYFGPGAVSMTLNGQADDGHSGEGDNISGFEGLEGGDGDDTIVGDDANNVLEGNGGDDTLLGAGGTDEFLAGDGDDLLLARGGRDEVGCGLGFDTPIHDAEDIVNGDCERRGAEVFSESARANRKGKAAVKVSCAVEEGATCTGKLLLFSNGKRIAKGTYSIPPGKTRNAQVRLTKRGRRALRGSKGSLLVDAEARTVEPQGVSGNDKQLELSGKTKRRRR